MFLLFLSVGVYVRSPQALSLPCGETGRHDGSNPSRTNGKPILPCPDLNRCQRKTTYALLDRFLEAIQQTLDRWI